jgi:predicted nuclease of predicted toxin-antitoxin system
MQLLLDQGLPRTAAKLLRNSGIDTLHVGEIGMAAAKDIEILEHAEIEQCIVVTLDSDFHTLLAKDNAVAPSVIRVRIEGLKAKAFSVLIQDVLSQCSEALSESGCAVTVQDQKIRIRRLPFIS